METHKRLDMNAFQCGQDKTMCPVSAYVAFNRRLLSVQAANGQTTLSIDSDIELSVPALNVFYMCPSFWRFVKVNICRKCAFCLVHIKKRSFLTYCVFCFLYQSAGLFFLNL